MYSPEFLDKVRSFGILGYSADRIIYLIDPEDPNQFKTDLLDQNSPVYLAYHKGKTTGEYSMDKELFDKSVKGHDITANQSLFDRLHKNKVNDTILERFGV